MRKVITLLAPLLVVFVAGCIYQPPAEVVTGPGVVIKDVIIEPEVLEVPGMTAYITLIVQNVGGADAMNIVPELIDLPSADFGEPVASPASKDKLLPPPPEGEATYFRWELTAPTKPVDMTYDFFIGVSYDYNTSSEAVLRLISLDYYRGLTPEERKEVRYGVITHEQTAGPLSISVDVPAPKVAEGVTSLPVWVKVENTGGGKVVGDIAVTYGGDVTSCDLPDGLELIQAKYVRFTCDLNVGTINQFKDYSISFDFTYRYNIGRGTTILVRKSIL